MVHRLSCSVACGILRTRNWTSVPCIAREILNNWPTREAQDLLKKKMFKTVLEAKFTEDFKVSIEYFWFYNFQQSTLKPTGLPPLAHSWWERRTEHGRRVTKSLRHFCRSHTGVVAWRSTVTAAAHGGFHEWVIPVWRPISYFSLKTGIRVLLLVEIVNCILLTSKCPSFPATLFCLLENAKDSL